MAISPEWASVGIFLSAICNAWGVFVSGAVLAVLLLWFETMVLHRKASRLGYTMILVGCVLSAWFVSWQEQYLLTRDYEKKLQASDTAQATLSARVGELSKVIEQQENMLRAKSNAMATLEAQYRTAQRTLATQKEQYRSTYVRARLASLRAEGLRLAQQLITNPSGPTPDFEIQLWSEATERTLYHLFHEEQIQQFNAVEKAMLTYAKQYAADYQSRSGGVLVKEETQEIVNGLHALLINMQVATLRNFSQNLNTIRLKS